MMNEHQLILGAAGIGVWRYEIQKDEFACDPVCQMLLGIPEDSPELLSLEQLLKFVHKKDRQHILHLFGRKDLGLGNLRFDFRTVSREKTEIKHLTARCRHLPDLGGEPGRLMGVLIDDTHQQRLAASLHQSEKRFETLARNIPNPVLFVNRQMQIEFASREFCDLVQIPVDQVEGKPLVDIIGKEMATVHAPYHKKALAGEHSVYEMDGRKRHGLPTFYRYVNFPVTDKGGDVMGFLAVATDLSERRRLERKVKKSEAQLRMLADGFPSLFVYLNRKLEVQFANDAFLKSCDIPMAKLRGQSCKKLLREEFPRREPYFKRVLAGEQVTFEDYGVDVSKDSKDLYFRYNYKPALDNKGRVIGLLCEATDISERRKLELELRRSNQDLEQFAYVASHDLKAPLRAIEVIVTWLKEDLAQHSDGDVQENLELLEQRTHRLNRLLDDLLAYSRAGRKVGKVAEVDTRELTQEIVNLLSPPEHLRFTVSESLPVLKTHIAPLEQVLRNLIGNAIKHHPGPQGDITIDAEETEQHYVFSVSDNGAGIPQEYADRIFQMFQTLRPRDEVEGSGMGLAIVSRIVEWQKGRVWFEDPPQGQGTVFKFQWSKTAPEVVDEERAA